MKKLITLILFVAHAQLCPETVDPTTLFLGSIKFPQEVSCDDICLYYKGQKLKADWDNNTLSIQFSFLESKTAQVLYVLICNDIAYQLICKDTTYQAQPRNNTVLHLQTATDNYSCYELRATRIYDSEDNLAGYSWDYVEHTLKNNIIPENTVIFLFDPKLIENIQIHSWSKNQTMRLIPTIKVVPGTTTQALLRTTTIARLTAFDLDPLHMQDSSNNKIITPKIKTL